MRQLLRVLFVNALAMLLCALPIRAKASALDDIGVSEHLQASLPRDVRFIDQDGNAVALGKYFDRGRPTVLVLGYHSCPMLCGLVQRAVVQSLAHTPWVVGRDVDVLVISIDPRDTFTVAANRRSTIIDEYTEIKKAKDIPRDVDGGWHYLVGAEGASRAVADAVGYKYSYDTEHEQYMHPAVVILLTPAGRVSRYLYGAEYDPSDMRLGIVEASEGKAGTTLDRVMLYCMHYDRTAGKHRFIVDRVMRIGGALIVTAMAGMFGALWLSSRRRTPVA